ncbi:MAG: hypothetical protein PVS2B1_00970 [Candidatus Dormibacteraceae bacterium]
MRLCVTYCPPRASENLLGRRTAVRGAPPLREEASVHKGRQPERTRSFPRFITWFEADFTPLGRVLQPVLAAYYGRLACKPVNGVKRYLEEGPPARAAKQ